MTQAAAPGVTPSRATDAWHNRASFAWSVITSLAAAALLAVSEWKDNTDRILKLETEVAYVQQQRREDQEKAAQQRVEDRAYWIRIENKLDDLLRKQGGG